MGSRPSFCRNCKKFLTSAIIKWWFSTSTELRKMTTWYCYKMKIGIYHEVTWRGNSTTTKWRLVLSSSYLKGTLHHYKMKIGFYHLHVFIIGLLEGNTSTLQNTLLTCFNMLLSEGQLALLQFEIRFIYFFFYVVFRWANSLATKWFSIFTGLSTTETLKTYKMI